ncbi:MAG TPA: hypothetical protein VNY07_09570 [Chthoniobacterales bacterium]|jgi:hypothetical protein|nr:hypothetical protein [Chthoniobacterales bacterium]
MGTQSQGVYVRSFRILFIALITLVLVATSVRANAANASQQFEPSFSHLDITAQGGVTSDRDTRFTNMTADDLIYNPANPALALTNVNQFKSTLNRAKIEARDESAVPAARDVDSTVPLAPEPPPWAMMAMGAVVLIGVQRLVRRKKA